MKQINVLAVDLGGGSGRGVLGSFDGEKLTVSEVNRFANVPINLGTAYYWDFGRIFNDVLDTIGKAQAQVHLDSVGTDTFGGTTCLIDKEGRLLENPQYSRDPNSPRWLEQATPLLSMEEVNRAAGYDMSAEFRQLLKMKYLTAFRPGLFQETDKVLFLPCCLNYYLCGVPYAEHSSTICMQWSDYIRREWNYELMELVGVSREKLPEIIPAGTRLGPLTQKMQTSTGLKPFEVVAVTEHDTGSAMSILASENEDCIFLSQGTMSVVSAPVKQPVLDPSIIALHCNNESNFGGSLRLTRNLSGLFLIQQCRADWAKKGLCCDYETLEAQAALVPENNALFDVTSPSLRAPGDIPARISAMCGKELTQGETIRAIYDSLAKTYRETIDVFSRHTGVQYKKIRALGGGCRSKLLCQCIARATGLPVVAGPGEATALGNLCVQLISLGAIRDMHEANQLIGELEPYGYYEP